MNIEEAALNLESIYVDFHNGLYTEAQLRHMLLKLRSELPDIDSMTWSEMVLDAQWKHATEADYELNKNRLPDDELDYVISETMEYIDDIIEISSVKVCRFGDEFYIGKMAKLNGHTHEMPWSRKSEYFESEIEAYKNLKLYKMERTDTM